MQNSYEGWLKIRNSRGQEGIVPTAYVEFIEDDQDIPPPPSHYPNSTSASLWESTNFSDTNSYMNSPPSYSQPTYNTGNQVKQNTFHPTSFIISPCRITVLFFICSA